MNLDFIGTDYPSLTEVGKYIAKVILDILVKKEHILYDFVLFLGINSDGSLKSAEDIRSKCPHILFFARVCCLFLLGVEKDSLGEDWLLLFESDDSSTSVSELQLLMGYLKSIGDVSTLVPSILWVRSSTGVMDFKTIVIDEVVITLNDLQKGIQAVLKQITLVVDDLLQGYQMPKFNLQYTDSLRNLNFGKSFESAAIKEDYQRMSTNPMWYSKFMKDGRWDITKCNVWIEKCDRLGLYLLFATHLVYGQPARASELEKMTVRNDLLTQRSIFVIDEKICLVQGYHKALGRTGKSRFIPRFLDKCTSKNFVFYQAFLRNWQQ
jgi:hypothetical protein